MERKDFNELEKYMYKIINKKLEKGNEKITVVRKVGKIEVDKHKPFSYIVRVIKSKKDIDTTKRLVRSKMNVVFEIEYIINNYENTKNAIKKIYKETEKAFLNM